MCTWEILNLFRVHVETAGGTQVALIINVMYATKLLNNIYHLMQPGSNNTLCGLRVSRVPMGAKLPGNLQLVENVPDNKAICKHCERLQSGGLNTYSTQRRGINDAAQ